MDPPPPLGAGAAATGAASTGFFAFLSFLPAAISANKPPRGPPPV